MSQNVNSTSPILPTARKSRRSSQRNRPVLVSSKSPGAQESQESQVGMLEPEISEGPVRTEPLEEEAVSTETPAMPGKARRAPRLPSFFSKVEKTQEEPETSQEVVVQARLARAKKATSKAEVTSAESEKKEDDKKSATGANRAAATKRPEPLFKTRHLIGMGAYLIGAEFLLPLEGQYFRQWGIDDPRHPLTTIFNIPIVPSLLLNLATLVVFLIVLVKLDLLPTSLAGRSAAAARAQQQKREQGTTVEKQPQPTMRQGVKGEDDDLYQAYRSNQRKEKKR